MSSPVILIIGTADTKAEPFAEADLANAAPAEGDSRRGGASLFARVTGAAKALHAATAGAEEERKPAAPSGRLVEPSLERKAPAPKAQPRLTGLDAAEKVRTAEAEEELLDIPAFLRRQAN